MLYLSFKVFQIYGCYCNMLGWKTCARTWYASNANDLFFFCAEGLSVFDFNKANSPDDVGCVYNFDTAEARDAFVQFFNTLWQAVSGVPLFSEPCVGKFWAFKGE